MTDAQNPVLSPWYVTFGRDAHPPMLTNAQIGDELEKRYGGAWSWDDPEWWADMTESVREYGVAWLDE